ncbi:hypothetical protein ACFQ7O_23750 [Streptomyces sp. NPDC056485]|uniref:hypothetical protein n=1 Tax=Streptomyces sp. NPDC056485 TaxID=3345834 RepID=UPI0036AEEE77
MNAHVRLLLSGALALPLLTCTVAAWANPQSRPSGTASAPVGAAADSDPCDFVIGAAHDYCTRGPDASDAVGRYPLVATVVPAGLCGPVGLLLFATTAIGAAVGLVLTVERRAR